MTNLMLGVRLGIKDGSRKIKLPPSFYDTGQVARLKNKNQSQSVKSQTTIFIMSEFFVILLSMIMCWPDL